MPSNDHEMPLELVRNRPALAPDFLRTLFGIDTPEQFQLVRGSEVLSGLKPAERNCDSVTLGGDPDRPEWGIILEVQKRPDHRKKFTWPDYVANLRSRRECKVYLMVLCFDKKTADWAAEPIELGHPGFALKPLVQNLAELPPITDLDEAGENPELTILLAKAHGNGSEARAALTAFCHALATMTDTPADVRAQYHEFVASSLSEANKRLLEEILATQAPELHSILARTNYAEGEAKILLMYLEKRGWVLSAEQRERIDSCKDPDLMMRWCERAMDAESADEIFG